MACQHLRMRRFGPPLLLMALIFFFSAQPDLNSGLGVWDTIGRKLIHAATYGALFLLWRRALRRTGPAVAITILYAISDEYHQTFVHGRHGSPLDVVIDAAGVMIAYGLATRGRRAARRPRAGGPPPAEARRR
jgi:VanZ family protein